MSQKPRSGYQRMQLAMQLAAIVERQATDTVLKEISSAIQLVLAAGAELLSQSRLARIEQLIDENSGNCCFKQRGYNWQFEEGLWIVAACTVCNKFQTWHAALDAAMRDPEFRSLKPS